MSSFGGNIRIRAITLLSVAAFAILAVAALSVSHAQLATAPWPMFHYNLAHTGLSPYDTSANPGFQKWKFATRGYVTSSPAIGADGTIYFGSDDGNLYAVNANGTQKWAFRTDAGVESSPAIAADGTIYVGSGDGNLYAVSPGGTQKWKSVGSFQSDSSPAIGADGTIYVGCGVSLCAVNANGSQKWAFATDFHGTVASSPAIGADGTIYFGSGYTEFGSSGYLYAVNPDGSQKWSLHTGYIGVSSPTIGADGTIYAGVADILYALTDGGQGTVTEKWAFTTTNGQVASTPAIGADGTIYIGSGYNFYAINPDGTQKWAFATEAFLFAESSPAIGADGTIYVASYDGTLYALTDGGQGTVTEKWAFAAGGAVESSPAIGSDGTIYIPSFYYNLYAVGIPSPTPTATATATATATPTPVAVTLKVEPKALKFPKTALGTSSKPKTVKVSNPKGNKKHPGLPVLIELISGSPPVFTEVNDCPPILGDGAVCTIAVTFTPGAAAQWRGTLVITDNAHGSQQTVPLSGTGKK